MRRRTLEIIASAGGIVLVAVLAIAGFVMASNASFAKDYVGDQLSREQIVFPAVEDLTPQDKAFTEARTGCLFTFAEQKLTTGKQAECYANEYIGSHLTYLATRLGKTDVAHVDGQTFRELGLTLAGLSEQVAAAEESNDPALAALEQEVEDITYVRSKMFEGSMLRNALLTSFGFSVLGEKAGQAATVFFIAAAVLALVSMAGFVQALLTPKTKAFAPVEPPTSEVIYREPALNREPEPTHEEKVGV